MIEPEIAFADLSDNVALSEGLLKYTFAALLKEKEEDLAFFDQPSRRGWWFRVAQHRCQLRRDSALYPAEVLPRGARCAASTLRA